MIFDLRRPLLLLIAVTFGLSLFGAAPDTQAQDKLGVFFDEHAGTNNFATTVDNEQVTAYATIIAPSAADSVGTYVGTISFVGAMGWGVEYYGGCWLGYMPYPTLVVSCEEPLIGTDYIVVAQYTVTVESPATQVSVYVENFFMAYRRFGSDVDIPLTPISGDFSVPVASINGAVGNSIETWGSIKSLYR